MIIILIVFNIHFYIYIFILYLPPTPYSTCILRKKHTLALHFDVLVVIFCFNLSRHPWQAFSTPLAAREACGGQISITFVLRCGVSRAIGCGSHRPRAQSGGPQSVRFSPSSSLHGPSRERRGEVRPGPSVYLCGGSSEADDVLVSGVLVNKHGFVGWWKGTCCFCDLDIIMSSLKAERGINALSLLLFFSLFSFYSDEHCWSGMQVGDTDVLFFCVVLGL